MKTLIINGSPREHGNTAALIAELKKELVFTHTEETPSLPAPAKKPEQLSMFSADKPSVLGKLAAAKATQKSPVTNKKSQEQALLSKKC